MQARLTCLISLESRSINRIRSLRQQCRVSILLVKKSEQILPMVFQRSLMVLAPGGLGQRLAAECFGPIARIGGRLFRIVAIDVAPDAAHKAKAITANNFHRRLVMIGRADSGARLGDDCVADAHSIRPPSLPAPWFG